MTPSNRRVKKPALPPEMLEEAGIADVEPLVDPPPPSSANAKAKPKPKKPATRAGRVLLVLRAVVGVILVVAVSGTVAWAARRHVMQSARFGVAKIEVTGARHRSPDEIIERAGLQPGSNVFSLDLDEARAKLLADPWIQDVSLARRLPGTLLIQVTERDAGALVALGETFVAARDGELFKRLEPSDPVDLPIITGLRADAVAQDREGVMRTVRRAIDLATDYEHTSLNTRAPLEEVHVAENGSITLVVGKNALSLVLGEPPYRRKLEQASRVMAELDRRGAHADVVMLDNEARPDRVVVRMR